MNHRLMGMEMECGFAVVTPDGGVGNRDEALNRFYQILAQTEPNLPGRESPGIFLRTGGRLYLDCGHPEITTAECSSPEEIVLYKLASEAILARALALLNRELEPKSRAVLFGNNFDYITNNTWGCHESYLHRADSKLFQAHLVPHLATRIVYTGVGGFAPGGKGAFLVSPRVAWLAHEVSPESTNSRGILHTRDESLSGPEYRRAHLISGENNRSQLATYLKMGTTALVILLIEQGFHPGQGIAPVRPLEAMGTFSADPTCRATAMTVGGQAMTALEIQREYLKQVQRCLGRPFMPAWAETLCTRWADTLDRLEGAPDAVSTQLDWAMKFGMYRQFAATRGLDWEQVWRGESTGLPKAGPADGGDFPSTMDAMVRMARARLRARHGVAEAEVAPVR
jgi:Pup amidohydrolase